MYRALINFYTYRKIQSEKGTPTGFFYGIGKKFIADSNDV